MLLYSGAAHHYIGLVIGACGPYNTNVYRACGPIYFYSIVALRATIERDFTSKGPYWAAVLM